MTHFEFPDTDLDPRPVMTSARRRPEAGCSWDSFRSVKRRKKHHASENLIPAAIKDVGDLSFSVTHPRTIRAAPLPR